MTSAGKVIPFPKAHQVQVVSDHMALLLRGEDNENRFALLHCVTAPRQGPPLHVHTREDETFHILRGTYEFSVGGNLTAVGPGDTVFGVRGVPHTYRNTGDTPAQMLLFVTPAGFEDFFECISGLAARNEATYQALTEQAADYGCTILGPPLGA